MPNFNPRSLHGERHHQRKRRRWRRNISIHAPCTGSDIAFLLSSRNPRISIHAPCTGSDGQVKQQHHVALGISIHAPCTGSDVLDALVAQVRPISIHAPCTGSDRCRALVLLHDVRFQSTLPARGATQSPRAAVESARHFNPRSPHGERLADGGRLSNNREFQSTLPARGATLTLSCVNPAVRFQSTLPARGATRKSDKNNHQLSISIHAPRTGSDNRPADKRCNQLRFQSTLPARGATHRLEHSAQRGHYFNPRSPHGERQPGYIVPRNRYTISIHAPRTGSDGHDPAERRNCHISIHAPRTGSDIRVDDHWTPPKEISIHAPRTGSDAVVVLIDDCLAIFQSTLPARGATHLRADFHAVIPFQSTLPARGATDALHTLSTPCPFQSTLPARGATLV